MNTEKALDRARKRLREKGYISVSAENAGGSVRLFGNVPQWEDKIEAGAALSGLGFTGIINDIEVPGVEKEEFPVPEYCDQSLSGKRFDVVIIGGGVIGAAAARELSKQDLSIALLEKEQDLAVHASGRNDGMVHPGLAAKPGTKKAFYNIKGNRLYTQLTRELGIPFKRPGSMILLRSPFSRLAVPFFFLRAKKNGVDGIKYLPRKKVKEMEPHLTEHQYGAIFLPSAGILSPYNLTLALAENAIENGAEIFTETTALGFEKDGERITGVATNRGTLLAGVVINAAGIWADYVSEKAGDRFFTLHGRMGVDCILDKKAGKYLARICAEPSLKQAKSKTKGGGLVPTIEGNILIGPTAEESPYREKYETKDSDIDALAQHLKLNRMFSRDQIITYFSGIRACSYDEDFIIRVSPKVENLIHAAGIQSPGLASAPAIAEELARLTSEVLEKLTGRKPKARKNFNPVRNAKPDPVSLTDEERHALIMRDPAYGRVLCRCEEVSEGEIRDALRSPIPGITLDGIKRRTRAGMGRCHGGFCTPRVVEIMAQELGIDPKEITKKGPGSRLFAGWTKETPPAFHCRDGICADKDGVRE